MDAPLAGRTRDEGTPGIELTQVIESHSVLNVPEISHPSHHLTDYAALMAHATAVPTVLGLVLKGSHAHEGMVTEHSDHDVYVIVSDEREAALAGFADCRTADLDLVVTTVEGFRRLDGLERYGIARGRVLLDRLNGEIASVVVAKGRLETGEASRAAAAWLDAYANSHYRSVKNARDGHLLAAHLDAADSIGFLLESCSLSTAAPVRTTST